MRYAIIIGLIIASVGVPSWRGSHTSGPAPESRGYVLRNDAAIPETVRQAADQGRYWRATRLLEEHLTTVRDTAPTTVLLKARLEAGWENWPAVLSLLDGRAWLDDVEGGAGWELLGRAQIAEGRPAAGAAALARYLERADPDAETAGLTELRRAIALDRAGEVESALEAFDRAAARMPWFGDWTSYMAAEAAAGAGKLEEVNRRLAATDGVGGGHWRLRVTAALVAGDTLAAREAALTATRTGSRTSRSEAWAELGRLRLLAGDTARGRAALVRAMDVRSAMGAVNAARGLWELGPTPGEWRTVAAVYRWHGNARRAAEGYEAYLRAGVGTPGERAQVRLDLGRARFDAGLFRQAERGLLALAEEEVPDGVAAEALYTAARAQYRQGRSADGQATFLRLADRFPDREAAARGLFLLADLQHDDLEIDGPEGARRYYRLAVDAAPDLNEAGLAMMRLAGLAYLEGDYDAALAVWEEYRARHPEGRRAAQATYWAARTAAALGRDSVAGVRLLEVREIDPLSFYGMRAAERLDRPILDIPMDASPARDTAVDAEIQDGIRRVDLLAALGRRPDLVEEVERLRRRYQQREGEGALAGEYALAETLNERGYTLTGIGMGWDIYEATGRWDPRLLRIVYPFPFRNLVVPEAEDRGLDPYMLAGLIRRESAFSPVVVSGAGAVGLMQIVPSTARVLARASGIRPFERELLTRPEINIHLGTRFLAELTERFGESTALVLAAYNAGPTRATAWRRFPEADDPELFMERVPYGETRNYIRNVLVHEALYRALYPDLEGHLSE